MSKIIIKGARLSQSPYAKKGTHPKYGELNITSNKFYFFEIDIQVISGIQMEIFTITKWVFDSNGTSIANYNGRMMGKELEGELVTFSVPEYKSYDLESRAYIITNKVKLLVLKNESDDVILNQWKEGIKRRNLFTDYGLLAMLFDNYKKTDLPKIKTVFLRIQQIRPEVTLEILFKELGSE